MLRNVEDIQGSKAWNFRWSKIYLGANVLMYPRHDQRSTTALRTRVFAWHPYLISRDPDFPRRRLAKHDVSVDCRVVSAYVFVLVRKIATYAGIKKIPSTSQARILRISLDKRSNADSVHHARDFIQGDCRCLSSQGLLQRAFFRIEVDFGSHVSELETKNQKGICFSSVASLTSKW